MDPLQLVIDLFAHADRFLAALATEHGTLVYAAMFLIYFLETGVVVMSFLPGDSLLFVSGTIAAAGTVSPWGLMAAVALGAVGGNTLGYRTGRWLGGKIYDGSVRWIDAGKLAKTRDFYDRHGGKTVVLARFVPIVRAFAPLVAGAAGMPAGRFEAYSAAGAALWAVSLIGAGYLFGNIPFVKDNLSAILLMGVAAAAAGPVTVAIAWQRLQPWLEARARRKGRA
ncbi:MAG: VTT domain-containing protein [Duodenibacillus sp.]|nr:VTT domain-containing protein [Duodenibacillus sp.]